MTLRNKIEFVINKDKILWEVLENESTKSNSTYWIFTMNFTNFSTGLVAIIT